MNLEHLKTKNLPDKPGVYFFKLGSNILYIGKATSLRGRTRSYFANDLISTRGPLIVDMVFKSDSIEWQETDSVLEALILEAKLIKKHQPYYNVREKDDRSFNYVCITKEKLPRVVLVRGHSLERKEYKKAFGPFTNGLQLREALKIIRRIFPFLDDKNKNYLEFYRQINLAPDLNDRKLYLQNIKNIKLFFEGKKKRILKNLEKEMKEYAKTREFERANEVKRQIFALKHINDIALLREENSIKNNFSSGPRSLAPLSQTVQKNFFDSVFRIEAYDIAHMAGKNMTGVMVVVEDGEATKNEYRKFKIRTQADANDTGALKEVLERRFNHPEWRFPDLIVMDGGMAQLNAAKQTMSRLNLDIGIVSVVKDDRHKAKAILGEEEFAKKYKREILLANSEAHRFVIAYHKNLRGRNFLNEK